MATPKNFSGKYRDLYMEPTMMSNFDKLRKTNYWLSESRQIVSAYKKHFAVINFCSTRSKHFGRIPMLSLKYALVGEDFKNVVVKIHPEEANYLHRESATHEF